MSLFIASLNSGSNGNCYYVGSNSDAVLVDAGISCREIEKRMSNLDLSMEKVKALFISHEHIDHIRGVSVLSKKYSLPVYITPGTYKYAGIRIEKNLHNTFAADVPEQIGELTVLPFSKYHDAHDPFSFVVEHKGIRVGVFTDIGKACHRVIHYFRQCHACFLESNYDEKMLEEGNYPARLKKRIRGGHGHLSNAQALDLFRRYKSPFLSHLLLSHLSEHNNHPDVALELFSGHKGKINVQVASRYQESKVITISRASNEPARLKPLAIEKKFSQLELFS